jgi:D-alanyl-D-alanine dipeptidase
MIAAGFTNYPLEWWHFDFGDQFWGAITDRIARYGVVHQVRGKTYEQREATGHLMDY